MAWVISSGSEMFIVTDWMPRPNSSSTRAATKSRSFSESSGASTLIATGRTPAVSNDLRFSSIPRNSELQNGHQ